MNHRNRDIFTIILVAVFSITILTEFIYYSVLVIRTMIIYTIPNQTTWAYLTHYLISVFLLFLGVLPMILVARLKPDKSLTRNTLSIISTVILLLYVLEPLIFMLFGYGSSLEILRSSYSFLRFNALIWAVSLIIYTKVGSQKARKLNILLYAIGLVWIAIVIIYCVIVWTYANANGLHFYNFFLSYEEYVYYNILNIFFRFVLILPPLFFSRIPRENPITNLST